ncbi:MAG TPA: SPOR domain-containing protein [Gemmatimonadales bacterium]|nr:SPOR domain-containing protein [Gemmatimonadales bacterium]
MNGRPFLAAAGLVAGALACQTPPPSLAHGLSAASASPPSTLLRIPSAGGQAQLYRPPALDPAKWKSEGALPGVRRVVGADLDQGLIYLLGAKAEVVTLDLQTGRVRQQVIDGVRDAAIGPDGTLYTVDDSNAVTQLVRRNPVRFQSRLPSRPRDLFGTKDAELLAITRGSGNQLNVLSSDQPPTEVPIPSGDAAATLWGDMVAVAADTAVVLVDPREQNKLQSIPISEHARAVVFSPSGHRLYVARREGSVLVFNRFTNEQVGEITLPGPARALRMGPFGRWLLINPPSADSVWLVDLSSNKFVAGFETEWSTDLPTVTNQQLLLLKSGGDVVAVDLTQSKMTVTGRVKGGAKDYWLTLPWSPETGTASPTPVIPESTVVAEDSVPSSEVFLQVSSSQNKAWAGELASQLSSAGLPARVIDPRAGEEGFRVVLGPYPTREVAESAGRRLGRPFFIYQPDRQDASP